MNPLIGTWTYVDCTIKNTSVKGKVSFYKNGTFCAEVKMREDHPTPPLSIIKGSYSVTGNMVKYSNMEFDHPHYHPNPFGKYFVIKDNYLYFSQIKIQKPKQHAHEGRWIYKLFNSRIRELFIKGNNDPLFYNETPPEDERIPGLFLYNVIDNIHLFSGTPIQSEKWIVTADFTAYKASEVLDVLKKMEYIPESGHRALCAAFFILKCMTGGIAFLHKLPLKAIQDYRVLHKIREEDIVPLIKPRVNERGGYFAVVVCGYYNIKGALFQFAVKVGKNVYEWDRKLLYR